MVLESLATPEKATRKSWELLLVGFLYAGFAAFLSIWVFESYASLVMVFLTVLASVPLMYNTMRYEEYVDVKLSKEQLRLKHHARALKFMTFMFLGFCIAFSLSYIFMPTHTVEKLFKAQTETIRAINAGAGGAAIADSVILKHIFFNNVKVLLFCIFFAFFYGAGAIFILTWNASVISAAIGNLIRTNLASFAGKHGWLSIAHYFTIFSAGFLRYLTHGIFEIIAYFIAGLAGSLISVAVINHDFETKHFKKVLKDVLVLILISTGILGIAALIEVYVTPLLF